MIETVKLFDDTATALLKSVIGHTLHAYEAYIMFENPDQVYKRVRLEFEGARAALEICNQHQSIPLGPEAACEEVSIMSAGLAGSDELWCPSNKEITRKVGVDLHVSDVLVVTDTAALTKGDVPINKLKLVQAVVLRDGGRLFAIDRDIWFDEYLTIREGWDLDTLVRKSEGDWTEEPPYGYKFTRDIISLAMGGIRV